MPLRQAGAAAFMTRPLAIQDLPARRRTLLELSECLSQIEKLVARLELGLGQSDLDQTTECLCLGAGEDEASPCLRRLGGKVLESSCEVTRADR